MREVDKKTNCERERGREQQQHVNGNEGGNDTLDFLDISSAGRSFWCQHNRRKLTNKCCSGLCGRDIAL